MSLFDSERCNKYIDEEIEITTEETQKINHCENCDSTSMEICLLIRHCKYWTNPYKTHEYR